MKGDENILLMGDHINDTDSIKKLKFNKEIKVGFLNLKQDSLEGEHMSALEAYSLHYDVCILNDGNLSYTNSLIKNIVNDFDLNNVNIEQDNLIGNVSSKNANNLNNEQIKNENNLNTKI